MYYSFIFIEVKIKNDWMLYQVQHRS